jgi:peptidoglycan hydrolase CwlO-like protein
MPAGFFQWFRKPASPPAPPDAPRKVEAVPGAHPKAKPAAAAPPKAGAAPDLSRLEAELKASRAARRQLQSEFDGLQKARREAQQEAAESQKKVTGLEVEVQRLGEVVRTLESQLAESRASFAQHASRVQELEALIPQHATLRAAYETIDRERQSVNRKLGEITVSRDAVQAERDRLATEVATAHATLAARDTQIAAFRADEDRWKQMISQLTQEVAEQKAKLAGMQPQLARLSTLEGEHARLKIEYEAVDARCDVARAQLAEVERALETAQATIKAAQRLSSSVEWRAALDSILDAASELVRFERGTLALVDSVQDNLKIEAARNSPIDVSQMSRFKVGEGIAGWALSHREPVLVRDSRSDPRFKVSDPSHQPRSFIAVPLLEGNDGLGVLTLVRSANDPFKEEDLKNLSRVGSDAARALTNARLVDFLKHRQDDLTTLVRKMGDLWAATEVKDAVAIICRSACELAGGSAALVALTDARGQVEVVGSLNIPDEVLRDRISWSQPAALEVMRSGKPWIATLKEIVPAGLLERIEAAGLRLLVSVPCGTDSPSASEEVDLLTRSDPAADVEEKAEVSGVIHVYRNSLEPPSSGELEQLQRFADQAAAALKLVRREERVKTRLQSAASVNARLIGRERYIQQLQFRISQLEQELGRYKAA